MRCRTKCTLTKAGKLRTRKSKVEKIERESGEGEGAGEEKKNDGQTQLSFYIAYSFGTTKKGRTGKAVLASQFHKSNIKTNHFPTRYI